MRDATNEKKTGFLKALPYASERLTLHSADLGTAGVFDEVRAPVLLYSEKIERADMIASIPRSMLTVSCLVTLWNALGLGRGYSVFTHGCNGVRNGSYSYSYIFLPALCVQQHGILFFFDDVDSPFPPPTPPSPPIPACQNTLV